MFYQIKIRTKDATRRIRRFKIDKRRFFNGYHNTPRAVRGRFDGLVTADLSETELTLAIDSLGRNLADTNIEVWGPFYTDPRKGEKRRK